MVLEYDGGQRHGCTHFTDSLVNDPAGDAFLVALSIARMHGAEACWCEPRIINPQAPAYWRDPNVK